MLSACDSAAAPSSGETPFGLPANKALVAVQFTGSPALSAVGTAAVAPLDACRFDATHLVTYLSFIDRNTTLADALDLPAAGLSALTQTALFAPPGEAFVYVIAVRYEERAGQEPLAVALSGQRLSETLRLSAGEIVTVEIDLAAMAPFQLAWDTPLDADDPWFGGPQPYRHVAGASASSREVGIWTTGTLPWDLRDAQGAHVDQRGPEIGNNNSVPADPRPDRYLFESFGSDYDPEERNIFRFSNNLAPEQFLDVENDTNEGTFPIVAGGVYLSGSSLSFPGVGFQFPELACESSFEFVIPAPPASDP